jgi:hypothetical protein
MKLNPLHEAEFGYVCSTFVGSLKAGGLPWKAMTRDTATYHLHSIINVLLRRPSIQSHVLRDIRGSVVAYGLFEEVGPILFLHFIHTRLNAPYHKRQTGIADKLLSEIIAEFPDHLLACTQFTPAARTLINRYGIIYDPTFYFEPSWLIRVDDANFC